MENKTIITHESKDIILVCDDYDVCVKNSVGYVYF